MMIVTFAEAVCDGWESNVCRPEIYSARQTDGRGPTDPSFCAAAGKPAGTRNGAEPKRERGPILMERMNNTVHQKSPIVLTW